PARPAHGHDTLVEEHPVGRHRKTGKGTEKARPLALRQFRREGRAYHLGARLAEGVAENVVDVSKASKQILAENDIALRIDEITVPLLALGKAPVLVPQHLYLRLKRGDPGGMPARAR